ncbi:hypothetical protein KIPB_003622 [Kipferlia bialata]|uniref:Uncharacterized protein n=1 Tax=Kipferlia bialata TaxID=797122 RepID=A0A9K3CU56_9EUKA|nr:hypothetical protein KIPB_003622 [Kipferlia bialata]|eukprot:g3622.t1
MVLESVTELLRDESIRESLLSHGLHGFDPCLLGDLSFCPSSQTGFMTDDGHHMTLMQLWVIIRHHGNSQVSFEKACLKEPAFLTTGVISQATRDTVHRYLTSRERVPGRFYTKTGVEDLNRTPGRTSQTMRPKRKSGKKKHSKSKGQKKKEAFAEWRAKCEERKGEQS